ncbi:MAG: SDR family NAD(P)-dependent oxidoreductase, partial [Aquabacterium sp.]|nr:SDR family NAD(P)-dependent oxidoreductase [Aquabacterium sp.]
MAQPTPHNRIALVTGAGSGIGLACAAALVADGWRVVYTGRRADALAAAIARAGDPWGDIAERAVAIPCDVGDEHSVAALFAGIRQRFGRLDLLF